MTGHEVGGSILERVAREIGVSRRTVIRVLAGGVEHRRPTARARAERIRALAEELGYRPNAAARAVSTGRQGAVTLLTAREQPMFLNPGLLEGIESALNEADLRLVLVRAPLAELETEEGLPRVLREQSSDGFLLNGVRSFGPRVDELLRRFRIPAIAFNAQGGQDCVAFDDHHGAREITRRLIAAGHRRIVYVGRSEDDGVHYSAIERLSGYREVLAEAGLEAQVVHLPRTQSHTESEPEAPLVRMRAALDPAATAYLVYDSGVFDLVAGAVLASGRRIPEDVSVVYVDGSPHPRIGLRPDHWHIDAWTLGRVAAEMILERIEHPERHLPGRVIPGRYFAGETLAPPPA